MTSPESAAVDNLSAIKAIINKHPLGLLIGMSVAMQLAHASWLVLITNFAVDRGNFNAEDFGFLHAVREIPGFMVFLAVFVILYIKEQKLALISLLILAIGGAATGFFPGYYSIFFFTFLTSIGFHYYEAVNQSLSLQWLDKKKTPISLAKILSIAALAQMIAYGSAYLGYHYLQLDFSKLFLVSGLAALALVLFLISWFPIFEQRIEQNKNIFLRKEYWLYYVLVFLGGARRQIFIVFAVFMLVERFKFNVAEIASLYLINCLLTTITAPMIGRLVSRFGEKRALIIEYVGLIIVFSSYALVTSAFIAAVLYVIDNLFFALAIAHKTYLQKIGKPEDMASTAAVSFSINHIAAVTLPPVMGIIWLTNPAAVFWFAAFLALISLACSLLVPRDPKQGFETVFAAKRNI